MKKICSLLLVCVMLLGILPVMSFAADPETITIEPYGTEEDAGFLCGWENWQGEGSPTTRTHLLVVVTGKKTQFMENEWRISFSNGAMAKIVTLKPTSYFDGWNDKVLYRFQPVDAEGENQFIPVVGVDYTVTAQVLDNAGNIIAESAATSGFKCNNDTKPILPPEPPKDPKVEINPYGEAGESWANWNGEGTENRERTHLLIVALNDVDYSDPSFKWDITIDDGKAPKTISLTPTSTFQFEENGKVVAILYRFQPVNAEGENKFVPVANTEYKVQIKVTKGADVYMTSDLTAGFGTKADFKPVEPPAFTWKIEEGVLYVGGTGEIFFENDNHYPWYPQRKEFKKVIVGDGITRIGRRAFMACDNLESVEFGKGLKKLDELCIEMCGKCKTFTFNGKPESVAYPFNQWGKVENIILNAMTVEELKNVMANPIGYAEFEQTIENYFKTVNFTVADPTPSDDKMIIEPWGNPGTNGSWENGKQGDDQKDETQFLIVAYNNKFVNGGYQWQITFNDGTTTKTVVLEPTTIEDLSDQAPEITTGIALYRFQPCNGVGKNQFVPKAGTEYKVTVQVLKDGAVVAETVETEGFGTAAGFAPIAPATPEPPVTGDATAIIAVLAVLSLFGTAVVVTKKVLA